MTADSFSIDAHWEHPPADGSRDVAQIRISAGSDILSQLLDTEQNSQRDHFRTSAISLAFWLADNWWRLRYESLDGATPSPNWRLRHELSSASGGTAWPPIMIHSAGEHIQLTSAFARQAQTGNIRYLLPDTTSVTGAAFEAGLDHFFAQVLSTCAKALDGPAISELLDSLRSERADEATAQWRRIEARLGYDPGTVPDGVMNQLGKLERKVGPAALDEAASAAPGPRSGDRLEEVLAASMASDVTVDLGIARGIGFGVSKDTPTPPWILGRRAAQHMRRQYGLGLDAIGQKAFLDLLGTTKESFAKRATARKLPYSGRVKMGNRHGVALRSASVRDRRFEVSCALADEIWLASDFGVISKAKTDRQKFQRAFAQNFLAPFEGFRQHMDIENIDDFAIDGAAKAFFVHSNVVKRALILEQVLPRETLEDRLEAG